MAGIATRALLTVAGMIVLTTAGVAQDDQAAPVADTVPEVETSDPVSAGQLDELVGWMRGSFSSAAQAAADPHFQDIRLHMVPIWTRRSDGRWLYVEQSVAEHQDHPYRQRVYRVSEIAPGLFESQVFTLAEAQPAIGAWRLQDPLPDLSPGDLETRDGCSILMRKRGDAYHGSTLGRLCESQLRGAAFATSEVTITAEQLISWDRGFDAAGVQVWGSVSGGYLFDRVTSEPDPDLEPAPAADSFPEL